VEGQAKACVVQLLEAGHYDEGKALAEQFVIAELIIAKTIADLEAERDEAREALGKACELVDELTGYALVVWGWKYGDRWREERAALAPKEGSER